MPFSRIFIGLAIVAGVVALAGCGSSGTTSSQSAALTTTTTVASTAPGGSTSTSSVSSSTAGTATASAGSHSASATASTSTQARSTSTAKSPARTPTHTSARLAVASSAFPKGAAMPVQYSCHGANTSPPLQWSKVPAGATQMFVLGLSLNGQSKGPIRWAVGGIDPSAGGFGAGQLPAGAVVGRSSDGHSGWVGPCPTGSQPETMVMLVYALRNKIDLAPGFEPSTVQRQLAGDTVASGIVYGVYKSG
jgi:phosphatidylethanolamine-binding protein (PEBP) family uncharacterized protein